MSLYTKRQSALKLRGEVDPKPIQEQIAQRIQAKDPALAEEIRRMVLNAPGEQEAGKQVEIESGAGLLVVALGPKGEHLRVRFTQRMDGRDKEMVLEPSKDGKDLEVEFTSGRSLSKLGTKNPGFKLTL